MLRARVFPDADRKKRQRKMMREVRKSEKQHKIDDLPDKLFPHQMTPEQIVAHRFDQELMRRLILKQPVSQIASAMGGRTPTEQKALEMVITARMGDHDFREMLNEYTLGGVQRLEAEIIDGLKELQMILRLSADEMMQIVLSIARRPSAKDSDRLAAANSVLDRAQALAPIRINASGPTSNNVFNFGADVVKEALKAFSELTGPQERLMPAAKTVGSMSVEERDELRQLATDESG